MGLQARTTKSRAKKTLGDARLGPHRLTETYEQRAAKREHADLVGQMRATRLRLGLSYEKLSAIAGYTAPTIWWLERRSTKPRLQTIQDLTQAMSVLLTLKENSDGVQ